MPKRWRSGVLKPLKPVYCVCGPIKPVTDSELLFGVTGAEFVIPDCIISNPDCESTCLSADHIQRIQEKLDALNDTKLEQVIRFLFPGGTDEHEISVDLDTLSSERQYQLLELVNSLFASTSTG